MPRQMITDLLTTSDLWTYIVQNKLQYIADISGSGTNAAGATGHKGNTYSDISTSPNTALEVWGFFWNWWIRSNAGLATTTIENLDAYLTLTYTQPSPPATNTTTDASNTGNLFLRNIFLQQEFMYNIAVGTTDSVMYQEPFRQGIYLLEAPIRIVGESLEVYINYESTTGSTAFDFSVGFLGKYVTISQQQYVELVALATGEAILPPSILG